MAKTHIVTKNETLSGIAQKYLGDASRWKELQGYAGAPEKLPIGTRLTIPSVEALGIRVSAPVVKEKKTILETRDYKTLAEKKDRVSQSKSWVAYDKGGEQHTLSKGFAPSYYESWMQRKGYTATQPIIDQQVGDQAGIIQDKLTKAKDDLANAKDLLAKAQADPYQGDDEEISQDIIGAKDPAEVARTARQGRITELEGEAFEVPEETQEMIDKREELEKAQEDYETALGTIAENPWLSEAGRVGRNKKLFDMFQVQADRLAGEYNSMADRQAVGMELKQAELNYLSRSGQEEEYLSIAEAKELGLAYGTTKKEAMEKGIVPTDTVKGWTDFTDSDKKKLAARGIDWTTEDGWAQGMQELYGEEATENEENKISDLLTNFGTRDYVSEGYYNQIRSMADISASEFDRKFGYLLGEEGEDGFEFSSNDKGRMIATGLNQTEINKLQGDINELGWETIKNSKHGFSEEQKSVVENILKGVTPAQAKKEAEEARRPSDEELQKTAEILITRYWKESVWRNRGKELEKAIKDIEDQMLENKDTIEINGKEYKLTADEYKKFKKHMKAMTYEKVEKLRAEE